MLIKQQRTVQNGLSTVGELSVDDGRVCYTLEDAFHVPKIAGITRIPAGTYPVRFRTEGGMHFKYAARFGQEFHRGMLWIRDVPDFEYVYFHCGNTVEDTRGCPLVGTEIIRPDFPDEAYKLIGSEKAYRDFYPIVRDALVKGESVWAQIIDPKE